MHEWIQRGNNQWKVDERHYKLGGDFNSILLKEKKMGLLDKISEIHIKKDEGGNEVFYPHGLMGKGFVLPDDDVKKRIRSFLKKYTLWGFILFFGTFITVGWMGPLLLIIPFIGAYYYFFYAYIKKLEVSNLGSTLSERVKIYGSSTNIFMLLFNFIISIVFIYIAIFLIIKDPNNDAGLILFNLVGIIFLVLEEFFLDWRSIKNGRINPIGHETH